MQRWGALRPFEIAAWEVRMMRQRFGRSVVAIGSAIALGLALGACGGSSRPAAPDVPTGLHATAGNGQVTLTWTAAARASAYNVYYGTATGVTKANGTKVTNITSTSTVVASLTNGTTYYFVVTAFNSGGESAESNEAFAQPVAPADFSQADMTGTWRFNAVAAGASPGWMRGTVTVAADGTATMAAFQDSAGDPAAPTGLFSTLLVDSSGQVRDATSPTDAVFTGIMGATNRDKVVLTSSANGTQVIAILLKHDLSLTFDPGGGPNPGDIGGFGNTAGGARRFVYSQIATGAAPQEWEFAQGQIGQNNPFGGVQYTFGAQDYTLFLNASGSITRPADKASILSLTTDGKVSEALNPSPQSPPPPFVMGQEAGFMSDDKSTIVATTTDASTGRSVLRIYQLINIGANDTAGGQPLSFALGDLNGTYAYRELAVGASTLSAVGTMTIDGTTGATALAESGGGTTTFTLAVDQVNQPPGKQNGILTSSDASSVHGKLGDFKDIVVLTRTDASGASRLTVAIR